MRSKAMCSCTGEGRGLVSRSRFRTFGPSHGPERFAQAQVPHGPRQVYEFMALDRAPTGRHDPSPRPSPSLFFVPRDTRIGVAVPQSRSRT